jgi:[ribosomal protein S18]-alanine N-acetyltransferase
MATPVAAPVAARPEDLAGLCALDAACFSPPWSCDAWRAELAGHDRIWRVVHAPADSPDAVGGLLAAGGLWLAPEAAHVLRLAVAPAWRGRGLGSQVVGALVAAATRVGQEALTLEVRAANRTAVSLYRRHGFVEAGVRPRYYPDGEDAVILWRRSAAADEPMSER